MQNLGGQTKSIMVFSEVPYFVASSLEQIQSLHKIDDGSKDCLFVF